jgi:hypothetical protein
VVLRRPGFASRIPQLSGWRCFITVQQAAERGAARIGRTGAEIKRVDEDAERADSLEWMSRTVKHSHAAPAGGGDQARE